MIYKRNIETKLEKALSRSPVTLLTGALYEQYRITLEHKRV